MPFLPSRITTFDRGSIMANRKLAYLGFLVMALASSPGFASSDGFLTLNNEAGSEFIGNPGTLPREEVKVDQASHRKESRLTEASPAPLESSVRAGFAP